MNATRLSEAEQLFNQAVDLPSEQRAKFLESRCADSELRRLVDCLIGHHDRGMGSFLSTPALGPVGMLEAPVLPERIGRYQIVRVIGEGGMGTVYEARQDNPSRTVALKMIRSGVTSRGLLRRFRLEAHVLGQLRHAGIAQIYEAGTADTGSGPQPFLAMEYIDGVSLTEYARRHELSTSQKLALLAMVCEAVHHAHQKGIIHRDLKPANILVVDETPKSRSAETPKRPAATGGEAAPIQSAIRNPQSTISAVPKVLDFGVARVVGEDVPLTLQHTAAGQIIGTLAYMSPEQIRDPNTLDVRCDVYALGVIGFELLTGRLPLDVVGKSLAVAARTITETEPPAASTLDRSLRGDVEAILTKALEKSPDHRYASANDLAQDLGRFLRHEPVSCRRNTALYQARKFVARHKLPVALAAALLIAVLGFGVVAAVQASRLTVQRDRALDAEARAAHRFEQVRELANSLIFDIHDRIRRLPGSTEARRLIIQKALGYLDALAAEAAGDQRLQLDLAGGYQRVGDVQGGYLQANVGDGAGARVSYRKALEAVETLDPENSSDPKVLRTWATIRRCLADMDVADGKVNDALQVYEQLRGLYRRLLESSPAEFEARKDVAYIEYSLGHAVRFTGRFDDAVAHLEESRRLAEALVEEHPAERAPRVILAGSLQQLGQTHISRGKLDDALTVLQQNVVLYERLTSEEPDDATHRTNLASGQISIGDVMRESGKRQEALRYFQEGLALRQRVFDADPRDAFAATSVAVAHERISDVLSDTDLPAATAEAREALRIWEEVAANDTDNRRWRRGLAMALEKVGNKLNEAELLDEGLDYFNRSSDLFAALAQEQPESALAQRDYAISYFKRATCHSNIGEDEGRTGEERTRHWCIARGMFVDALKRHEDLVQRGIAPPADSTVSDMLREQIGLCDENLTGTPCSGV